MPIFMKYGTVKGDATAEGHKGTDGWMEVSSFQFGIGRGIATATGSGANREAGGPSVSEVTVTKQLDVATTPLIKEMATNKSVECVIEFCKTESSKLDVYMRYTLTDTLLSAYSVSSGGDRPSESLSLNFSKFECWEKSAATANTDGSPLTALYDIATGVMS